jgi:hypothetical protein
LEVKAGGPIDQVKVRTGFIPLKSLNMENLAGLVRDASNPFTIVVNGKF